MHWKYISGTEKRKKRKLCADAAQKGSLTLFHVDFQRYESLTPGRVVEQSAPFGSSSPRSSKSAGIDMQLNSEILSQKCMWREVLKRIVDVILFLRERGLAFHGS